MDNNEEKVNEPKTISLEEIDAALGGKVSQAPPSTKLSITLLIFSNSFIRLTLF